MLGECRLEKTRKVSRVDEILAGLEKCVDVHGEVRVFLRKILYKGSGKGSAFWAFRGHSILRHLDLGGRI